MKRGESTERASKQLLTADALRHHLDSMGQQIADALKPHHSQLALVGIQTRGVPLARRLADQLETMFGHPIPVGTLDITLYRDDIHTIGTQPEVRETELPFGLEDRAIVLVDDVLFTGRTVRSAMNALIDYGRPRWIQLAALIDRGHRELPVAANFVGLTISTNLTDIVDVNVREIDGDDGVTLRTFA